MIGAPDRSRMQTGSRLNGPAATRRAVDRQKDGANYLDITYNVYQKGMRLAAPYAYRTDEFCFVPNGSVSLEADSGTTLVGGDDLMWRQAGASSNALDTLEDSITVCAFSPAWLNADSGNLAPEEIGKWRGDRETTPRLHFFKMSTSPEVGASDRSPGHGFVEREVISKRKDSSDVSVIPDGLRSGRSNEQRPCGRRNLLGQRWDAGDRVRRESTDGRATYIHLSARRRRD